MCVLQALQCFQEAATEVEKEEFLIKLTGSEEEEAAASSPRLQYFNKVHTHSQELPLVKPRVAAAGNKLWIQSGAAITGGRWFARARDPVSFSGYNGGRE